jgi:hypothetical protein
MHQSDLVLVQLTNRKGTESDQKLSNELKNNFSKVSNELVRVSK